MYEPENIGTVCLHYFVGNHWDIFCHFFIVSRWGSIIWFVSSKLCTFIEKACFHNSSWDIRFRDSFFQEISKYKETKRLKTWFYWR